MLKYSLLNLVLFLIFDAVWLGVVAASFFKNNLSHLLRIEDGNIQVNYVSAVLTYVVMSVALEIFVFGSRYMNDSLMTVALLGAAFGFAMFGVYDLTSHAIFRDYPTKVVIVDMSWGTFMTAAVASLSYWLRLKIG